MFIFTNQFSFFWLWDVFLFSEFVKKTCHQIFFRRGSSDRPFEERSARELYILHRPGKENVEMGDTMDAPAGGKLRIQSVHKKKSKTLEWWGKGAKNANKTLLLRIFGGFCYRMQEWISSAHWKCLFLLLTNEDNGMGVKTFFVAQRPKRGQKPWKSFAFITSFHWCSTCQLISRDWRFHNFSLVVGFNMFQSCNGADAWKPLFCSLNKAAIKCYNYATLVLWLSDYCPIALLVNKKYCLEKTTCSLGKTSQRCIFLPVPLVYN